MCRRKATHSGRLAPTPSSRSVLTCLKHAAGESEGRSTQESSRIAGIMAAKKTSELIPMCHPLGLTYVDCDIEMFSRAESASKRKPARLPVREWKWKLSRRHRWQR